MANGAEEFPEFQLRESSGSKKGQCFVGPGNQKMANQGERQVKLRLGHAGGKMAGLKFQEAKVRRPIVSVGESSGVGNLYIFDQVESAMIPKGSPEIEQIRALVQQAKERITMVKDKNTFTIPAWIEPASRPFARPGPK